MHKSTLHCYFDYHFSRTQKTRKEIEVLVTESLETKFFCANEWWKDDDDNHNVTIGKIERIHIYCCRLSKISLG